MRNTIAVWIVSLAALVCCSPGVSTTRPSPEPSPLNPPPAPSAALPAEGTPTTQYRVGDFVEYLYSGTMLSLETRLTERIVRQEGNQLRIEVHAVRGDESLKWVQVVTDTPENQKNEVIDELYEEREGTLVRLENKNNADVYRLYSWTIPPLEGKPAFVGKEEKEVSIGEHTFSCSVEKSTVSRAEGDLALEFTTCKDFLWTNGPAVIRNVKTDDVLWRREVTRFGNAAR